MSDWDTKVQPHTNKIHEGDEGRRAILRLQPFKLENKAWVLLPVLPEAPDGISRNLFVPLPPLCNARASLLPHPSWLFTVSV